jgi:hypothetical protein
LTAFAITTVGYTRQNQGSKRLVRFPKMYCGEEIKKKEKMGYER